ncbi:MAG: DUF58 domain-containing protein, partial [Bacteroidota bacterium]
FESGTNNEELFSALQHLKYRKHEVVLFHVIDMAQEMDFKFDNRPYHFIDMESGEEIKLNPTEIKQQYIESMTKFKEELVQKCGLYQIDLIEADINKGFDNVLYTYLVKRHKMMK